jgi:hypothetical protein
MNNKRKMKKKKSTPVLAWETPYPRKYLSPGLNRTVGMYKALS